MAPFSWIYKTPCVRSLSLLHDQFHGLVIVSLDLEVGHPAVALGRRDVLVAQKVLDRREIGVSVQKLRGEGVPLIPSSE